MKIEYKVRPVTTYIVTRYEEGVGSSVMSKQENADTAYRVAYALCKAEHEQLGYPVGDMRIIYPEHPNENHPGAPVPVDVFAGQMSEATRAAAFSI